MTTATYDFPAGEIFTVTSPTVRGSMRRIYRVERGVVHQRSESGSAIVDVVRLLPDGTKSMRGHGWRYFHHSWTIETKEN